MSPTATSGTHLLRITPLGARAYRPQAFSWGINTSVCLSPQEQICPVFKTNRGTEVVDTHTSQLRAGHYLRYSPHKVADVSPPPMLVGNCHQMGVRCRVYCVCVCVVGYTCLHDR